MKIGELFVELGFHTDTVKVNDFIQMIGRLNLTSVLASFGVKELYDGLRAVMDIADQSAVGMNLFNKETGLSAQKMEQWSRYAKSMGVDGESVVSALGGIQKKLTGLKLGTDSSLLTPLYILNQHGAGLTGNENPFDFLEKALKSLHTLNPQLKTTVAGMLGINEQLLAIESFKDAKADVLSPEDVQNIMAYHKSVTDLGNTWKNVWEEMGAAMAPTLDGLAIFSNYLVNLVKHSETFVQDMKYFFVGLAAAIAVASGPVGALLFLLGSLLALIGQVVHYWPQIQAKMPNFSAGGLQSAANNITSGIGNTVQSSAKSVSTTMSNIFHIVSNDAKGVAAEVHKIVGNLLSDAQYQQPLVSR